VEEALARITRAGRSVSVVAVPLFLWFSTRLFSGIRTALNNIYAVSVRPPSGHFLVRYLRAKLRDLGMVLLTLVLFLSNTVLTTGLALLQAYSRSLESGGGWWSRRWSAGWARCWGSSS